MNKRVILPIFLILALGLMTTSVYAQECQSDSDCKSTESGRHCNDKGQACFTLTEYKCEAQETNISKCVVARTGSGCSTCSYGCENGYCKEQVPKEVLPAENKTTAPIVICTETDGGKNYDVKGISKDSYGGKTDYCDDGKYITEFFCEKDESGNIVMKVIGAVLCSYGCKDGACLPKPAPVCGNGICENEDEKTTCSQDCKIKCYQDSDCSQAVPASVSTKYCGPKFMPSRAKQYPDDYYACKSITKSTCQNPGTFNSQCITAIGESCIPCTNGCKEGECISSTPISQCTDSDGGINYYVAGCVEMLNDPSFGIEGKKCDFCTNNNYLQEYVCENGIYRGDHTYQCNDLCRDGACTKGEQVKEQVKCVFENSNSEQRCSGSGAKYSCPGKDSCVIDTIGNSGEKLVWESTCGGYAYTVLDGNDEYAKFNCQATSIPTNQTTPVSTNNFKNAYWQCQDGKEEKQGDESSCKPSEVWKQYAEESCKYHCNVYDKDHKKCAISLNKENPVTKLTVKRKEYVIELVSISDTSVTLKIAGSESLIDEFAEGARVVFFDLTFVINSVDNGKASFVIEGEDNVACMKCGVNSFSVYDGCSSETIINPPVCGNGICESGEWEICEITATTCKEGETCKASTAKCRIGCQQDCPKGKEGIHAKLNEKFKLQVSQEAKFTDYQNLVIKFNDLFVPKCGPTLTIQETEKTETAQTQPIKSSTVEKYSITGNVISPLSSFLTQPTKPAPSSSNERCIDGYPYAVLQMKFYGTQEKTDVIKIQLGEKKKVSDAVISFLDYDKESKSGLFFVSKDDGEFKCPENCVCDIFGQIKECKKIEKCPEKQMLCPDGACREKCEITNITTECKFGCFYQDKCLPYGLRINSLYCHITNDMKTQLNEEEKCENNFECSSNLCLDSKCVSSGILEKILNWFKKLFS